MKTAKKLSLAFATAAMAIAPAPAFAGWKRITTEATDVGKGAFVVTPQTEWSRWSRRPSKNGEIWTQDGFGLNMVHFIGQVGDGETLFKDRKKKERPMPKVRGDMLVTDLAELFEASFSIEYDVTQFDVRAMEPSKLGSHDAIKMTYEFALPNDALTRVGEARLAKVNGKVYLVNFIAPELHYYDQSIGEVQAMMDTLQIK